MDERMAVGDRELRPLKLLGKGKGGYSYLVEDGQRRYVLKQIHHEPCDYYTFGDKLASELRDYERLRRVGIPIPALLAADRERERILKEYIEGETACELLLRGALPETCLDQVLAMSRLAADAGLNIDYYPTNFVLRAGTLYYIDYECNQYMPEWDFEHWGAKYWAPGGALLSPAQESK
jgi:TP53 regulating kinase-like protein